MVVKCKIFEAWSAGGLEKEINEWFALENSKKSVNSCFHIARSHFNTSMQDGDVHYSAMFTYTEAT